MNVKLFVDQLVIDYSNVMAELISEEDSKKVTELQKSIKHIIIDLEKLGYKLFVAPMTTEEFKIRFPQ